MGKTKRTDVTLAHLWLLLLFLRLLMANLDETENKCLAKNKGFDKRAAV
jgi:hypothetical protein